MAGAIDREARQIKKRRARAMSPVVGDDGGTMQPACRIRLQSRCRLWLQ